MAYVNNYVSLPEAAYQCVLSHLFDLDVFKQKQLTGA